jgi:transposase IS116/IS110/IS902 family protein
MLLERIDELTGRIEELTAQIDEQVAPFAAQVAQLDAVTGIGLVCAQELIAELGVDMAVFPTAAHLVAWAKFAPQANISAGKPRRRPPARATRGWPPPSARSPSRPGAPAPSSASATAASPNAVASNAPSSRSATPS